MADVKRRIVVLAIQTNDKKLIPIWDQRVKYEKSSDCGEELSIQGEYYGRIFSLVECIYDLKTKELSIGIELDIYPDESKLEYKVGEKILHEVKYRELTESVVKSISYENYELDIKKGKKIEPYYLSILPKDLVIEPESIYALKIWKPTYLMEDGFKTDYSHQIYKKA